MVSVLEILDLILYILSCIVIAQIILSWLINFNILNRNQQLVMQMWNGLNQLLHPIYSRIRRFLPYSGPIDFAPLVVIILVWSAQIIIRNNL